MPKSPLKIIELTLLLVIVTSACGAKDDKDLQTQAKRSLLEREREFFKTKPMSDDLKSFIQRYSKNADRRKKRSGPVDENLLYVIQNGQLVPLKNLKDAKRSEEKRVEPPGYTVVPLIVPVNNKVLETKLVKTRTLNEDLQSAQQKDAGVASVGESTTLGDGTTRNSDEIADDGSSDDSRKDEDVVLHKILEDVQGLMQWKHEGNKKEGVICNINGSWISEAAGMRFDISYKNSTRKKFRIHLADRIPPNEDGFLCDGNWSVYGELPFMRSGMVIALAVHAKDKHIATFIGECRICEGSETVTGTWLVGRSSRDCKDQKASHKVLSDVWKREQAHTLRKKHLQQIGYDVKEED